MKKLLVELDGREIEVSAIKSKGRMWLHFDGETHEYLPASEQRASSSQQSSADPKQIVAPMPGKVLKVLKSVGDSVSEGETIVVMEAMKMEYNLKALADMKVEKINCSENTNVGLGEVLVNLEEPS